MMVPTITGSALTGSSGGGRRRSRPAWGTLLLAGLLAGCDPGGTHPREADPAAAPVPPGSIPRGTAAVAEALRAPPAPLDDPGLRERGRERYAIYCAVCHGATGAGDGGAVRHGYPAPAPLSPTENARPERVVAAITAGAGRMLPMGEVIEPRDRWAIAAHVRTLGPAGAEPPNREPVP